MIIKVIFELMHFNLIFCFQGLRKTEQLQLIEEFKHCLSKDASAEVTGGIIPESPEHEAGRIKKLEKLIKKRM